MLTKYWHALCGVTSLPPPPPPLPASTTANHPSTKVGVHEACRLVWSAYRISRMVRNPVVGSIDSMLLSFNSPSQFFVADFPQMAGKAFGDLYKW